MIEVVMDEVLMIMIGMMSVRKMMSIMRTIMSLTRTIIRRLIQAIHTTRISVTALLSLLLVYSNVIRINFQEDFIRFPLRCYGVARNYRPSDRGTWGMK